MKVYWKEVLDKHGREVYQSFNEEKTDKLLDYSKTLECGLQTKHDYFYQPYNQN
jgi:hypothetical protein